MKGRRAAYAAAAIGVAALVGTGLVVCRHVTPGPTAPTTEDPSMIDLPDPDTTGTRKLESLLQARRSHRRFAPDALELGQLGQLLWAAQGCTTEKCFRTAPSAGGTFPLEMYAVTGAGGVMGLDAGVYHYVPRSHALELAVAGDLRADLARESLKQEFIAQAPATLVVAADVSRTAKVYHDRARRYVDMEAGHAGQNVYLQAEALGLGTVAVGAFHDARVTALLELPAGLDALYVFPVGKPLD
jgi:SagB-type dehydrogenase family enzyme